MTLNGNGPALTTPKTLDFQVRLKTYLGSKSHSVVNINSTYSGLTCVDPVADSSILNINTCFTEGRLITISKSKYQLQEVNPSPVRNDYITVSYTLALEADTKLDLYNSYGVKVQSLVNQTQQSGDYDQEVAIKDFANGVYFIRLESGPFTETKKLIIAR